MSLLSQNSKMKKASLRTYDFAIPAIDTCIGADKCKAYCYATRGAFNYPNVVNKFKENYNASTKNSFVNEMNNEIAKLNPEAIRMHSSGDFYSREYLHKWISIAQSNKDVVFYCYTKSIPLFINQILPDNFKVVYSLGGKYDYLIKEYNLRSCDVVNYYSDSADSSDDDDSMIIFSNRNIELLRR
jgi:hypothetical protein